MYWQRDPRRTIGGYWYCAETQRARQRKRHHSKNSYWHRADGGYIRRRRRQLAAERERIFDQLATLREEEQAC